MGSKQVVLGLGLGLLLATSPVFAHHSFKAQYDESLPVTLSGTVTKVTWKNPHVILNLNVKDETGDVTNWELELASPNGLLSQGWKVDTLKPGSSVSASGYRARGGYHMASIRKITLGH